MLWPLSNDTEVTIGGVIWKTKQLLCLFLQEIRRFRNEMDKELVKIGAAINIGRRYHAIMDSLQHVSQLFSLTYTIENAKIFLT